MKKVLVANRGEIAVRIIRACRELNLETVAVYSTADATALHIKLADQAVCIGPAPVLKSYLNQTAILTAAKLTHADAIHPGYGFLSENGEFARKCQQAGLTFIGPAADVIDLMGEKAAARKTMLAAGVPVIPGSQAEFTDAATGLAAAKKIGFPVMLKASAGGGGKGMRIIKNAADFSREFALAQNEAQNAFGNGQMYLEKYLAHPRHIEVQLLADQYGRVLAVGERDCTIQQHHQKVIEEAPAVCLLPQTRQQILQVTAQAAEKIHYVGAGTIEFLLADSEHFYFMEMNTRIQVEHPITELTSQIDLVKWQLKIAVGEHLPASSKPATGFALECRINAFSAGKITGLHLPGGYGIRVDTALYQGYLVPPNYDAMIAKIIAYGEDRLEVIQRMQAALDETVISGIQTNLDFLLQLLREPDFQTEKTDINWLDQLSLKN
ncbi:acetyl-CoA carboxylase biotin carboxylase subunit [Liquorilactobacillus vini]|uniref:biotin carboxylase n=2 Tax=Liquorilactobacillus vini TaxID=238015 RepID=A0A0R2C0R0_9LACO|nr:acetyl-CoA carboxylase biotin carboxylase subunit [Liquorilactobacillus vini]KRM84645.1 biotin carboxylase of acetyl-coa carboxylase [Liquorilactobacillus vini DSM 20605]